jgi:hypothetical protein
MCVIFLSIKDYSYNIALSTNRFMSESHDWNWMLPQPANCASLNNVCSKFLLIYSVEFCSFTN